MKSSGMIRVMMAWVIGAMLAVPLCAQAQSLTIQGRLLTAQGDPLLSSDVEMRIRVYTDNSARCVLYEETRTGIDLSDSNGLFSINLNTGAFAGLSPRGYTFENALSNYRTFSLLAANCDNGVNNIYTPGPTSTRRVSIAFKPTASAPYEDIPDMELSPSAYAMEARTIGGFPATAVLRVVNGANPGTAPVLDNSEAAELKLLAGGTSEKYVAVSGTGVAQVPSRSTPPSVTPPVGSMWFDSAAGRLRYVDSGGVQTVGASSGGGAPSGSASGDLYGTYPNPGVGRIQGIGVAASAPTAGQVFKYEAGSTNLWTPSHLSIADLRTTLGAPQFGSATCAAGSTLTWSSVTDAFSCTPISITKSQVSDFPALGSAAALTAGTAAGNVPVLDAGGKILASVLPASAASPWLNGALGELYYSGSNVGIGTSSPGAPLDVRGAIRLSGATSGYTGFQPATNAGSTVWTLPTTDGAADQVLKTDGAGNLGWYTPAGSGISTINGTAPIVASTSSGTTMLSMGAASSSTDGYLTSAHWSQFNSKLSAVVGSALNAANIWVGNGTNQATAVPLSGDATLASSGALTVTKIQGTSVSATAPADGRVLKYVNTSNEWQPGSLSIGDLKTALGAPQFTSATCPASSTLVWSSVTDTFSCQAISITKAQVSDFPALGSASALNAGTLAGDVPVLDAGGKILASLLPAGSATQWVDGGAGVISYGAGYVGIGTTSPSQKLHVAGDVNIINATGSQLWTARSDSEFDIVQNATSNRRAMSIHPGAAGSEVLAVFAHNGTSLINGLHVRNGTGNVAIGTGTATTKLTVNPAGVSLGSIPAGWGGGIHSFDFYSNNGTFGVGDGSGTGTFGSGLKSTMGPNGIYTSGTVGIGTNAPTALLHLKAGTATASTAPLKFTTGTNLTTPEDGAMEYNGSTYFLTVGNTRYAIPLAGGSGSFSTVAAGAGSNTTPSLSFSGDADTGFYNTSSNNTISVAAGGAKIFDFSSAGLVSPTTGGASVTSANGTAAAPTYGFAGDPDTGWFRAAADTLAAATAGTERMRIDSTGKVAIGVNSALANLHVASAQTNGNSFGAGRTTSGGLLVANASGNATIGGLTLASGGLGAPSAHGWQFNLIGVNTYYDSATDTLKRNAVSGGFDDTQAITMSSDGANHQGGNRMSFWTGAGADPSERMVITNSGNVGIGTTSPGSLLDVAGMIRMNSSTQYNGLTIQNGTYEAAKLYGQSATNDNGVLGLNLAGTNYVTVRASGSSYFNGGNVGIGTAAPLARLDVQHSAHGLPATSGTVDAAIASRIGAAPAGTNVTMDMGVQGGTGDAWIQSRSRADFALNYKLLLNPNGGNVGVGTTTPRATLDVNGTVVGKPATSNATTTINFATGNMQYTGQVCQPFALHNLKDGGTYMFVVQNATQGTCSFAAFSDAGSTALTMHLPMGHGATMAGKHTVYNFAVLGTHVYASWMPGY